MNQLKLFLFASFLFFFLGLSAQSNESGDLVTTIGTIIDNMPGSSGDDYIAPSNTQLGIWETCLLHLIQRKYADAELIANQLDYELIRFTDIGNNQPYYILRSQSTSDNLWGTFVFNPKACQSNLVIQAPHPRNDSNTGDQGIYILKEIGALFYMVAGTHRCNSDVYSECSGTTSTCDNGSESYRESDMAHIDHSIFHKTTEILLAQLANPYFIQLHGFTKRTTDPYLILSNGTTTAPSTDYLSQLGAALVNIDPVLTYKVAHITPSIRLKGTTNTQGRLINGSTNPCATAASMNSGRFLHIEQERFRLRANATGWQKLADALKVVFRNLDLATNTLHLDIDAAYNKIIPSNTLSNGSIVNLTANELVQFSEGFHGEKGNLLVTQIDGCPPKLPLQATYPLNSQLPSNNNQFLSIAPNPFWEQTTIAYQLDTPQKVSLEIFNAAGQLVEKLVSDRTQVADFYSYSFRGLADFGAIYFVVLTTEDGVLVQKVVVAR